MDEIDLGGTAGLAVRTAAGRAGGRPLGTGQVLAALAEVDGHGRWDRLWLRSRLGGDVLLAVADDGTEPPVLPATEDAHQFGVELSPALAASFAVLRALAAEHDMRPVPPGALALALLCEPTSAVVRELTRPGGRSAAELRYLVQEELLGTRLQGFERWLEDYAAPRPETAAEHAVADAVAAASGREPDDIDLVRAAAARMAAEEDAPVVATMMAGLPPDVDGLARGLSTRPVGTLESGEELPLMLALLCLDASPGCAAVLGVAGLTGRGAAVDLRLAARGSAVPSTWAVMLLSLVDFGLSLAGSVSVVAYVLGSGPWWALLLIPFLYATPPLLPVGVSLVVAAVAVVIATPVAAAAVLAAAAVGVVAGRLQRRRVRAYTGVLLTAREHRAHLARSIRPRRQARRAFRIVPWRTYLLERRVPEPSDPDRRIAQAPSQATVAAAAPPTARRKPRRTARSRRMPAAVWLLIAAAMLGVAAAAYEAAAGRWWGAAAAVVVAVAPFGGWGPRVLALAAAVAFGAWPAAVAGLVGVTGSAAAALGRRRSARRPLDVDALAAAVAALPPATRVAVERAAAGPVDSLAIMRAAHLADPARWALDPSRFDGRAYDGGEVGATGWTVVAAEAALCAGCRPDRGRPIDVHHLAGAAMILPSTAASVRLHPHGEVVEQAMGLTGGQMIEQLVATHKMPGAELLVMRVAEIERVKRIDEPSEAEWRRMRGGRT